MQVKSSGMSVLSVTLHLHEKRAAGLNDRKPFYNKSEGGLPRYDRHKADMRNDALCRAAWLTYDPEYLAAGAR